MTFLPRIFTRTSAFLVKESVVAFQQPRLLLSVIIGPFLLLALFSAGFTGNARGYDTVLVVPDRASIPTNLSRYQRYFNGTALHLVGVTKNEPQALQELRKRQVDTVIVAPSNPLQDLASDRPAVFKFYNNLLSPVDHDRLNGLAYAATRQLNADVVAAILGGVFQAAGVQQRPSNNSAVTAIRQQLLKGNSAGALTEIDQLLAAITILRISGQNLSQTTGGSNAAQLNQVQAALRRLESDTGGQAGVTPKQQADLQQVQNAAQSLPGLVQAAAQISPAQLAQPTDYQLIDIAPSKSNYVSYYAPIVLVLLLEHVAITLAALSAIRERTRGTVELFEVAPIRLTEILLGKSLSFILILGILSVILILLIVFGLGVPFLGSVAVAILVLGLLIVVSVAIGFCLAGVSTTETQTVQLAMLVLLFAIFFGGLFVPIYTLDYPIRGIAYVVPVTEAGDALRAVMLRGNSIPWWPEIGALGIMAAVFVPLAYLLMRKSFSTH